MRDGGAHRTNDARVGQADRHQIHDAGEEMMFCQTIVTARRLTSNSFGKPFERMAEIDDVGGFSRDIAAPDTAMPTAPRRATAHH